MSEPVFIVTLTESQCVALSFAALNEAESFAKHCKPSPEVQQVIRNLNEARLAILEAKEAIP